MSAERILLTGATGGVGSEVLRQLSEKTDLSNVTVFSRASKSGSKLFRQYPNLKIINGDITNNEQVTNTCKN